MNIRKPFLISAVIILSAVTAFAQNVNFFTPEMPSFSIKQNLQFNLVQDSKYQGIGTSIITDFDMKELYGSLGVNFVNGNFDITTEVVYWPTFFDKFNAGVGVVYHLYDYVGEFTENDFLFDLYFKIKIKNWMTFYQKLGFSRKAAVLETLDDTICNNSFNIDSILYFYPSDRWTLFFQFSSVNYFDYPLFFTAMFNTGAEFDVVPSIFSTGIDINTEFYNFVVNSQDLGQMNVKVFGRLRI